jgi:hypothetical protein
MAARLADSAVALRAGFEQTLGRFGNSVARVPLAAGRLAYNIPCPSASLLAAEMLCFQDIPSLSWDLSRSLALRAFRLSPADPIHMSGALLDLRLRRIRK